MNKIFAFLMLSLSSAAFAQDSCQAALKTAYDCSVNGGFGILSFDWATLAKFSSILLIATSIFLRLIAEVLGLIASKTKNTWDNKALHVLMDVINFLGKIIGWFGVGKPRLVK